MNRIFLFFLMAIVSSTANLWALSFFKMEGIKYFRRAPRDGIGVWQWEKDARGADVIGDFLECLEVTVSVKQNIAAKDVIAKAYFYNESGKLLESYKTPSQAGPPNARKHFNLPVILDETKKERFFFAIPETVKKQRWKAVIVFGDKHEVLAATYPDGASYAHLDFPEKQQVSDSSAKKVERKRVMDKVVEHVVKTNNPRHPQITLFLRPPKGVDDWKDVQGVLALVVLAPGVEDIRRQMQAVEIAGDDAGTFAFANKHKLAILAWGSRGIWDARRNYDEFSRQEARELDKNFDLVANAWEQGVQYFHKEYGLPTNNFLMRGSSGAAQWAKRLCLRKPDYFLAIHIHIPSSFDKPTPEAAKVLWCLTTGELESGYERSLRFFVECRRLGYPILYKAIPGLGHASHPQSTALGNAFLEFAMSLKAQREEYDRQKADTFRKTVSRDLVEGQDVPPWPKIFAHPPFYGDIVNQEIFSSDQMDMIPVGFRMPLPTKQLVDIWK